MFFKICLRMKYVLQDHNQSPQVLHLEILVNRTILQNLPTKNNVCNKPDHEDLWGCKTSHNMFPEFLPSIFWWHLTPNRAVRSCTTPSTTARNAARKYAAPAGFFPFSSIKSGGRRKKTLSTLLGMYHFRALQYKAVHLGLDTITKINGQLRIE